VAPGRLAFVSPHARLPSRRRIGLLGALAAIALGGGLAATSLGIVQVGGRVAGPPPRFVDETATSGLDITFDGPLPFAVGGGVAAFDCDDDGRQDLYLAGGERPSRLFRNTSDIGGEIRFEPMPGAETDLRDAQGAYPIDIDSDGNVDLAVLRVGENVALRGLGECRFERANEAWGLSPGDATTVGFSATWEGGSSWPTIAFGNYLRPGDLDPDTRCQPSVLVRPVSGGDGFGEPLDLDPAFCTLSLLFSDWSGTGRMDLRVSNDRAFYRQDVGQEQLWRLEPGVTPRRFDEADGWARVQVEGMGIGSHDVTGDGLPDVYLTSQAASKLQTLASGPDRPAFADIGLARNANVAHPFTGDTDLPSTAWHPEFADVNNDGLIDLFVSKGNVDDQPDYAIRDPSNLLLGEVDGTFREAADRAGIVTFDRGRGAALVDLNLDGRLDLVESFYGAPVRVWRNAGPVATGADGDHWLALRLEQPAPNVDAIGAKLDVRVGSVTTRREITIGGGHAGGQLGWIHVGLGAAERAEIRVVWPGGEAGPWLPIAANEFGIVTRNASTIEIWRPPGS
jgi:enediyne biosynthesis protein E4